MKLKDIVAIIAAIVLLTIFIITGIWIVFAILFGIALGAVALLVVMASIMEYFGDLHERWEQKNDSVE